MKQILILLLLYGKQENQILCQETREGFPTAAPSPESNVDMNPSNEELYMIDDPEIMKVLLPKLEAALVTKTETINEFLVDQLHEIGMCSKISCVACLRLLAYERHFKTIKIPRLACLQGFGSSTHS
ncbi:Oidioi.mRNA.OKI2018_I69.chr1.g827.t1.cds [Oikopleura dioica]|uniref:Oidioi.mRNA.OKI2018_I69.chr1.g827.t1.cds n=1 Tax=Oikopleura dioica TaxID=34765 RepID=A0ABN7SR15_OIKDI|nr:Oidioi.mRNA.OKI2018_I69.chr1.g827.t1.cds [Oikopleura dioica]